MKFYSYKDIEGVVHFEATPFSCGVFYEAKDLTKHPFLDRYKEEIAARIRSDRAADLAITPRGRSTSYNWDRYRGP